MNAIRNYSAEWLNNIPPEQALPIWLAGIPTLARDCCEAFGRWPAYFWTTDYVHGTFSFGVKDATALKLVREDPQILAGNQKGRRHFHHARSTSDTNLQTKGFVVPSLQAERKSRKQECVRNAAPKAPTPRARLMQPPPEAAMLVRFHAVMARRGGRGGWWRRRGGKRG